VVISWTAVSGSTYQLQTRTNVASGSWSNVGNALPGINGTLSVTNPMAPASRLFYRMQIGP
jgi:hypothetical protein